MSRYLVAGELLSDGREVLLGEDEADVLEDVRQEALKVGVLLQLAADGLLHHGVLAHENDGMATQADADLLHLRRADVVSADDEALGVLLEQALFMEIANVRMVCTQTVMSTYLRSYQYLGEVLLFPFGSAFLDHL